MHSKRSFVEFIEESRLHKRPIFFDGGLGTMIQAACAVDQSITFTHPEDLVFSHPDLIAGIHRSYASAGAHVITAHTFGANQLKMGNCMFCAALTVETAVGLAKEAAKTAGQPCYAALDIGPTGGLFEPAGDLTFERVYETYKGAAMAAEKAGADLALIETMSDLYETKAAILAIKENTLLPVVATMTFQQNGRTLSGSDVSSCIAALEALGVCAVGFNCGGSLEEALELTESFAAQAGVPVLVQPNAGIPVVENGKTVFKVTPEQFAQAQKKHFERGAALLGGCCGTTPEHISRMTETLLAIPDAEREQAFCRAEEKQHTNRAVTRVCSYARTVDFSQPRVIGERINPTGKKKLKEAFLQHNLQYVADEAASQMACGADILDVNTGMPGIDEKQLMCDCVQLLQKTFTAPLQIDSSDPAVLEAALRIYNGKALVNSVNAKNSVMDAVFPLIKKYGGVLVALTLDENGIPPKAEGRLELARRIIEQAASYGIRKSDILIDALTLTVSSQQEEAAETLKTVRLLKTELGVKTILGVSNISFGLPCREIINAHFLTAAFHAGLDACIINPLSPDMNASLHTYRVLTGLDKNCLSYVEIYGKIAEERRCAAAAQTSSAVTANPAPNKVLRDEGLQARGTQEAAQHGNGLQQAAQHGNGLQDAILRGYGDRAAELAEELLKTVPPSDIIDSHIVPALDKAGTLFESGKLFLPQLMLCADTVAKAFAVIKAHLAESGAVQKSRGTVLVATVHGDVHDIGKNIARALMENYGFTVIDMGKNVSADAIVQKTAEENISVVGLSALMTTTVASMEHTITLLRQLEARRGAKIHIMAGGAVLTEEYAKKIGADYYVKDALAGISVLKTLFPGDS